MEVSGEAGQTVQDQPLEDTWDALPSKKKKGKRGKDAASEPVTPYTEVVETEQTNREMPMQEAESLQPEPNVDTEAFPTEVRTADQVAAEPEADDLWGPVSSKKKGKKSKKGAKVLVEEPGLTDETTTAQDEAANTHSGLELPTSNDLNPDLTGSESVITESTVPEPVPEALAEEPEDIWTPPAKGKKGKKGKKDRQQQREEVLDPEPACALPPDDAIPTAVQDVHEPVNLSLIHI